MLDAILTVLFANVWIVPVGLVSMCFLGIWWASRESSRYQPTIGETLSSVHPGVLPEQREWAEKVQRKLAKLR
jgi:hypothetical protein